MDAILVRVEVAAYRYDRLSRWQHADLVDWPLVCLSAFLSDVWSFWLLVYRVHTLSRNKNGASLRDLCILLTAQALSLPSELQHLSTPRRVWEPRSKTGIGCLLSLKEPILWQHIWYLCYFCHNKNWQFEVMHLFALCIPCSFMISEVGILW